MKLSSSLLKELLLYILVGAGGVVFDGLTFAAGIHFGLSTITAQWLAAFVGSTHNYIWHFTTVFQHNQSIGRTYFYSMLMTGVIVILSGPLLVFIESHIEQIWISKILTILATALFAYLVRKIYIFKESHPIG